MSEQKKNLCVKYSSRSAGIYSVVDRCREKHVPKPCRKAQRTDNKQHRRNDAQYFQRFFAAAALPRREFYTRKNNCSRRNKIDNAFHKRIKHRGKSESVKSVDRKDNNIRYHCQRKKHERNNCFRLAGRSAFFLCRCVFYSISQKNSGQYRAYKQCRRTAAAGKNIHKQFFGIIHLQLPRLFYGDIFASAFQPSYLRCPRINCGSA